MASTYTAFNVGLALPQNGLCVPLYITLQALPDAGVYSNTALRGRAPQDSAKYLTLRIVQVNAGDFSIVIQPGRMKRTHQEMGTVPSRSLSVARLVQSPFLRSMLRADSGLGFRLVFLLPVLLYSPWAARKPCARLGGMA
jgi:hypothetical protein